MIRQLIKETYEYLIPAQCILCGSMAVKRERLTIPVPLKVNLCFSCLSKLVPHEKDRRYMLCLSEPYENDPYPGLRLYLPFSYDGFFSRAIPKIKFDKKRELAEFVGMILGSLAEEDGITGDLIVPVPLSKKRMKERGYNQAEVIARGLSDFIHVPVSGDCLIRTRETMRQTELKNDSLRSSNVEGAFAISEEWDVTGINVILTDDVVTTGNTMHEAALALLRSGANDVLCVCSCGNRTDKNAESF